MRIKNLMERKIRFLDFLFIAYFSFLTFFDKPHWCEIRNERMTTDCREDIYGNNYYLLDPFSSKSRNPFLKATFIMIYFNIKYYIIYVNIRKNVDVLKSNRKIKLVLVTLLNILHFLFYFFTKDQILTIDGCSIIKVIFLFVVMFVNKRISFQQFQKDHWLSVKLL